MTGAPLELSRTGRDVATWTLTDPPSDSVPEVLLEGVWRPAPVVDGRVSVSILGPAYTGTFPGVRITRSQRGKVRVDGIERADQAIQLI